MSVTNLEFHPLTYVEEPDGVVVGRSDAQSYAVLPSDGAALLRRLASGMSTEQAANWYFVEFGEPIDISDFVETLRELRFVRVEGEQPAEAPRVRWQWLGRTVFSRPAWAVYLGLLTACAIAVAVRPAVRPAAHNLYFTSSFVAVQLVLTLLQVPATGLHEWFHVLAGRRLGLPTRLGVSTRLYFVVFETRLDGLLGVPRRKRYLPFLAGMLADLLMFCALTLAAVGLGTASWVGRLALAFAFTALLRLAWQTYVFLRTDLYYVFTTLLGCTNLHEVTSAYLRARFSRVPGIHPPIGDEAQWSARDLAAAPWFALISAVGVVFLLATTVLAVVPLVTMAVTRLGAQLDRGAAGGPGFWDSVVALFLLFVQIALPVAVSRRDTRRAARASRGKETP